MDACRATTIGVDAATAIQHDRTTMLGGWSRGKEEPTGTSPTPVGLTVRDSWVLVWSLSAAHQCNGGGVHAGKDVRDAVSATVARAFDTIFPDANPRLIPVLDHTKVHLELLKWDSLYQQLEAVEVRPVAPGASEPALCGALYCD